MLWNYTFIALRLLLMCSQAAVSVLSHFQFLEFIIVLTLSIDVAAHKQSVLVVTRAKEYFIVKPPPPKKNLKWCFIRDYGLSDMEVYK